jgi:hypothetical protein
MFCVNKNSTCAGKVLGESGLGGSDKIELGSIYKRLRWFSSALICWNWISQQTTPTSFRVDEDFCHRLSLSPEKFFK